MCRLVEGENAGRGGDEDDERLSTLLPGEESASHRRGRRFRRGLGGELGIGLTMKGEFPKLGLEYMARRELEKGEGDGLG